LEDLANHRGSALGAAESQAPQPSQKAFESRLANQLWRLDPAKPVWIEAESAKVGVGGYLHVRGRVLFGHELN